MVEFRSLHVACDAPEHTVCNACAIKHATASIDGKTGTRVACPQGTSVCRGELADADLAGMGCKHLADMLGDNQMREWTATQVGLSRDPHVEKEVYFSLFI